MANKNGDALGSESSEMRLNVNDNDEVDNFRDVGNEANMEFDKWPKHLQVCRIPIVLCLLNEHGAHVKRKLGRVTQSMNVNVGHLQFSWALIHNDILLAAVTNEHARKVFVIMPL